MAATLVALNLHKPTNIITRWPNKSSWLFNSVFIFEITHFYKNHTLILHKNLNHVGLLYNKRRRLKIPCVIRKMHSIVQLYYLLAVNMAICRTASKIPQSNFICIQCLSITDVFLSAQFTPYCKFLVSV